MRKEARSLTAGSGQGFHAGGFGHRRSVWLRKSFFRTLLGFAVLLPPLLLAAELGVVSAQLPPPNPLVVPPLPPSPPAQLPAPMTTAVAPLPLTIPSLPAAYATAAPRTFNCSCSGPGTPTHWMGQVTAASYASAEQSSTGACVSSGQGRVAPAYGTAGGIGAGHSFGPLPGAAQNVGAANSFGSPGVSASSAASSLGSLPGATQRIGQATSFGSPQTGLSFSSAQQQRLCSRCVCD